MDKEHSLELKMAEEELSQVSTSKKIRQSISVPFVWEVIPGTPKKDWKPTPPPAKPMATPVKLIVSVPFGWEEKPGKPLPYCSQPPPSSPPALPQAESNSFQSPVKPIASVPFEWGKKPGEPLPCCLQPLPASSPVVLSKAEISNFPLPAKLVASVPFQWEEKPGKPLPCFSQPPSSSPLALPQAECYSFPSSLGPSEGNGDNWISMNDQDSDETEMLESDPETCEYETDDASFSSVPSFSANSFIPAMAAVTSQQSPTKDVRTSQLPSPCSPASETESTSSYATGTTSLVGASFLEWLFPLLTPHSRFHT